MSVNGGGHRFDTPGGPAQVPRLPFDVPFTEAIAWAEARGAVLPDEFYGARLQSFRARTFAIAGMAALDQVQAVADSLTQALADGETFTTWQRRVREVAPDTLGLPGSRLELIFRNAAQTAYGVGRTLQQRENAEARPYLMWDAINDSRTRPTHLAMDGHIAPVDDPIWRVWNAPAGHACRCSRVALTQAQARARGYPKAAPAVQPDEGWAGDPTEGNEDLLRLIQARLATCDVQSFAAKKTGGRGLWCDEGEARNRAVAARAAVDNGPMTDAMLRQSLGDALFDRSAAEVSARVLPVEVAAAGLSLAEKVAVYVWTLDTSTTPWFARINALMRMAEVDAQEYATVSPVAGALLGALEKLPPFVGTVYRAVKEGPIGREAFEQFVREHETLPEVYHPGFVGASAVREGVLRGRAILTLQSVSGRDISSLSSKPEQVEVLFRPPLHVAPEKVLREGKVVQIWAREI